jgi:hypothetical protein
VAIEEPGIPTSFRVLVKELQSLGLAVEAVGETGDITKFGKEDLTPFANTDQITHLISDSNLSPEWVGKLKKAGINFTLCEEEAVPAR